MHVKRKEVNKAKNTLFVAKPIQKEFFLFAIKRFSAERFSGTTLPSTVNSYRTKLLSKKCSWSKKSFFCFLPDFQTRTRKCSKTKEYAHVDFFQWCALFFLAVLNFFSVFSFLRSNVSSVCVQTLENMVYTFREVELNANESEICEIILRGINPFFFDFSFLIVFSVGF